MSEELTRPFTTLSKESIAKIIAASLQDTPSKKPRVILDTIGKVFPQWAETKSVTNFYTISTGATAIM